MNWYKELSSKDNIIKSIELAYDCVKINILKWNNEKVTLIISDYLKLKESHAIESEIGEIVIKYNGSLIEEAIKDAINAGGTKDEVSGYSEIEFYDSWDQEIMLSVVAKSAHIVRK